MRKLKLFLVILLLLVVITGCILKDTEPPKFNTDPTTVSNAFRPGETATINLDISDNSGIDRVEMRASSLPTPFATPLSKLSKGSFKGTVDVKIPFSDQKFRIQVYIYDKNGNYNIKEIDRDFSPIDDIAPEIASVEITKIESKGTANYLVTSQISEIGSGIREAYALIGNDRYDIKITNIKPSTTDTNYLYISSIEGYYLYKGTIDLSIPLLIGKYDIKLVLIDKKGNRKELVNTKQVLPETDTTAPEIDYVAPVFVEPGLDYKITLIATDSESTISEIGLNDYTYPVNFQPKIEQTLSFKAPDTEQILNYTFRAKNFKEMLSTKSFTITVAKDRAPTSDVAVGLAHPSVDDLVPITSVATDDMGLQTVRVYVDSTKLREYGISSFKKDKSYGWSFKGTDTWKATNGNHKIRVEAIDIKGQKTESYIYVQVKDLTAPVLRSMYLQVNVGGDPTKVREIRTQPTFPVAVNDQVRIWAEVADPQSGVKSVKFTLTKGGVPLDIDAVQDPRRPSYYYSNELYKIADLNQVTITVTTVNIEDVQGVYTNNSTMNPSNNTSDVYAPKIPVFVVAPAITQLYSTVAAHAEFQDDGQLVKVSMKFREIIDNAGTERDIPENPYIVDYPGNKTAKLDLSWVASKPGTYVAIAEAENNLPPIKTTKKFTFNVNGLALDISSPTEGKAFNLGRDVINYTFYATVGATATINLINDRNSDGVFDETPTATINLVANNADTVVLPAYNNSPVFRYQGQIATTDMNMFPTTGKYRFKVATKFGTFSKEMYKDVNIQNIEPPVLESFVIQSAGITTKYPNLSNSYLTGGYYDSSNKVYYVPLDYSLRANNTQLNYTITVSDYGQLKSFKVYYGDVDVTTSTAPIIVARPSDGKRVYTYTGMIPKTKAHTGNETLRVQMKNEQYDSLPYSYTVYGFELEKPHIDEYNMTLTVDASSVNIPKGTTSAIYLPAGQNYTLDFNQFKIIDDDTGIGKFKIRIYKVEGTSLVSRGEFQWTPAYTTRQIDMSNLSIFGPNRLSTPWTVPSEPGDYKMFLEVQDKVYTDTVSISSVETETRKYNKNVSTNLTLSDPANIIDVINFTAVDLTPPAVTLSMPYDATNRNKTSDGYYKVSGTTFDFIANIQDKYDQMNQSTIEVWISMPDGTQKKMAINSITKDGESYKINVGTFARSGLGADKDGKGRIFVKFKTTITKKDVTSEPLDFVLDLNDPKIGSFSFLANDPAYPETGSSLIVSVDDPNEVLKFDIKSVVFGIKLSSSTNYTEYTGVYSGGTYRYQTGFLPAGTYDVYAKITDLAGNSISKTSSITIEKNAPTIDEWISSGRNANKLVFNDAAITAGANLTFRDDTQVYSAVINYNSVLYDTFTSAKVISASLKTVSNTFLEGGKSLKISLIDSSSNGKVYEGTVYKDNTAPTGVTSDPANPTILSEYNVGLRALKLHVTDNIGVRVVKMTLSKGLTKVVDDQNMLEGTGTDDWDYRLTSLPSNVEDTYDLTVTAVDLAGNSATFAPLSVEIDTKAPSITIPSNKQAFAVDANYVIGNDTFYAQQADLSKNFEFSISDKNINILTSTGSIIPVVDSLNKSALTAADVKLGNSQTVRGKIQDLISTSPTEKEYLVNFKVADAANHETTLTNPIKLVYDATAPSISAVVAYNSLAVTTPSTSIETSNAGNIIPLKSNSVALRVLFQETNLINTAAGSIVVKYGPPAADPTTLPNDITAACNISDRGAGDPGGTSYNKIVNIPGISLADLADKELYIKITDLAGNSVTGTYYFKK